MTSRWALALACLALSACSVEAPRYSPSMANATLLRAMPAAPRLGPVDAAAGVPETGVSCAAMTVTPPEGGRFVDYIAGALRDDITAADNRRPGPLLAVRVEEITLDAAVGQRFGYWTFRATVTVAARRTVVNETYRFQAAAIHETFCQRSAGALPAAVEQLVKAIVSASGADSPAETSTGA